MVKFATGAIALVMCIGAFSAQAAERLPAGSYVNTCKDIAYAEHTLSATCQMRDGGWAETTLPNPQACGTATIANENGQLRCDGHMPAGSYLKSCDSSSMNTRDGTIHAACQTRNGAWVQTKLDNAWECNGMISNQDGQLQCDKP